MKHIARLFIFLMAFCILSSGMCDPVEIVVVQVQSVSVSPSVASLEIGGTIPLSATVKPADADEKTVAWTTSDPKVATVNASGLVSAKGEGQATITASAGGKSGSCQISVREPEPVVVDVASVSLDRFELTLKEGESTVLTATVKPDDATDKTVTWSSSDVSVATVKGGKITAVAPGNVTITAKAGTKTATCKVTVEKRIIAVESLSLDKPSVTLTEGESVTLVATVKPDDATDKTVTWSSSDHSVASVDEGGVVYAHKPGTAVVTAKTGEFSATCNVTVEARVIPAEAITLDNYTMILTEGEKAALVATVLPSNATDRSVYWYSGNPAVATVEGGVVTAVSEGTAAITAAQGNISATCTVTVKKMVVSVTSVTLNKPALTLEVGESETLVATVSPVDATVKTVSWSSSDGTIASVDSQGKVTAIAPGSATITASAGDKKATCVVTVPNPGVNGGGGKNENFGNENEEW